MKKIVILACLLVVVTGLSGCKKEKSFDEMSEKERDEYMEEKLEKLEKEFDK